MSAVIAAAAAAQSNVPGVNPSAGIPSSQMPGILSKVSFDQRLNEPLPLDLHFKDEAGRDVRLGEFFGRRPVILAFVYYECPMLCTQVLNGLTTSLMVLDETVGREFDVVVVSFDPRETPVLASGKKKSTPRSLQAAGIGERLAFPDRRRAVDHGADRGRRVPVCVGRQDASVRASQRDCDRHAPGQAVAVLLRDRVRAARRQICADRVVSGTHRQCDRSVVALLLSLRPGDRFVRVRGDGRGQGRWRGDAAGARGVRGRVDSARAPRRALTYEDIRNPGIPRTGVLVRQGCRRAVFFHHRGVVVLCSVDRGAGHRLRDQISPSSRR